MPGEGDELREDMDDMPEMLLRCRLNALKQLSVLSLRSAESDDELNEAKVGDLAICVSGLLSITPWEPACDDAQDK